VLVNISNGLLCDERVFHVDNMPDFFEKYSAKVSLLFASQSSSDLTRLVRLEITMTKAWDHGGPKSVQEEALKRLKTSGLDMVRPALSTTVRYLAPSNSLSSCELSCLTEGGLYVRSCRNQDSIEEGSPEFYRNAVEVLEWGVRIWKDVPKATAVPFSSPLSFGV